MARPKKWTDNTIEIEAKAMLEYMEVASIPFKQEFALQRGYPSEYISRFAKTNSEFNQALKRLEDKQLVQLVKAMLAKKIDTGGAIFTLKNVAGWRDKQAIDVTTKDYKYVEYKNTSVQDLQTRAERLADRIVADRGRTCTPKKGKPA